MITLSILTLQVSAQEKKSKKKKIEEISFEVDGVCSMCKTRIENACLVKGVKRAEWDQSKHKLTVWYNPSHITLDEIHQNVANVGHDTDKIKASDEAYDKVHECCKYRTDENH